MRIRIHRLDQSVPLPQYKTPGAVAFDFHARSEIIIAPRGFQKIPTGLVIATPAGHMLVVSLRSSTPERTGLVMPHGVGIIDQDFSGPDDEIKILVQNITDAPVTITAGERVAQGMIVPIVRAEWEEASPSEKSRGGFGSTGSF